MINFTFLTDLTFLFLEYFRIIWLEMIDLSPMCLTSLVEIVFEESAGESAEESAGESAEESAVEPMEVSVND